MAIRVPKLLPKLNIKPKEVGTIWPSTAQGPLGLNAMMQQAQKAPNWSQAIEIARKAYREAWRWIHDCEVYYGVEEVAFANFKSAWTTGRNIVNLQARLVVEQVLWNKGGNWRRLVSGFRPLD